MEGWRGEIDEEAGNEEAGNEGAIEAKQASDGIESGNVLPRA